MRFRTKNTTFKITKQEAQMHSVIVKMLDEVKKTKKVAFYERLHDRIFFHIHPEAIFSLFPSEMHRVNFEEDEHFIVIKGYFRVYGILINVLVTILFAVLAFYFSIFLGLGVIFLSTFIVFMRIRNTEGRIRNIIRNTLAKEKELDFIKYEELSE